MDKKPGCPICGKQPENEFAPFCSKRCADLDLGKWFRGDYAVPVVEDDEDMTDESEMPPEQMH
ncbi:MAG: DNA gyrase inhibitor YacG [Alphaproteobacteria bacterium]